MLGRRWSDAEQGAYRSYVSVGRILDEAWILISLPFFFMWMFVDGIPWWTLLIWGASGWLYYLALGPLFPRFLPPHVRAVLPVGRFEGPSVPGAPRSYRELFRVWRAGVK